MEVSEAYSLISRAIDAGHAAHGYLIVGDVRDNASELTHQILLKLFPDAKAQVESGSHPDVVTLAPSGKGRRIKVEKTASDPSPGMRDAIIEPMVSTSFAGGWKVGVIVSADRMQPEAANAFLKLLEEPRPKTLFLLLTDQPDAILPTIISRTQRIDLPLPKGILEGEAYDRASKAFAAKDPVALAELAKELVEEADEADVPLVRKTFYKTLLNFARKLMLGGKLPRYQAFRNIEAIEDAYRQSDRANMGDEMVISFLLDRIVFPS